MPYKYGISQHRKNYKKNKTRRSKEKKKKLLDNENQALVDSPDCHECEPARVENLNDCVDELSCSNVIPSVDEQLLWLNTVEALNGLSQQENTTTVTTAEHGMSDISQSQDIHKPDFQESNDVPPMVVLQANPPPLSAFGRYRHQEHVDKQSQVHPARSSSFPGLNVGSYMPMNFEAIRAVLKTCCLPKGWVDQSDNSQLNFLFVQSQVGQESVIMKSLTVQQDGSWQVRVFGQVMDVKTVFPQYPTLLQSPSVVLSVVQEIHERRICSGNPDEKFWSVPEIQNGRGLTGQMVRQQVLLEGEGGKWYNTTLRAANCELTTSKVRCSPCEQLRKTMFAVLSRQKRRNAGSHEDDPAAHRVHASSSVPLSALTADELYQRTHNIIKAKRRVEASEARLRVKLQESINQEGECLDSETSSSMKQIISEYDSVIQEENTEGTFRRLFWEQQKEALRCADKRGHRWHPMFIKWCLNLRLRSSAAYNTLRDSGVLELPHERTLIDYTHWTKATTGFTEAAFDQLLRESNFSQLEEHQKYVVLLHDELRISSDLVYVKSSGQLIGFVNIGDFSNSLMLYEKTLKTDGQKPTPEVARYILTFMVRGITLRLQYPLAHFPTNTITADYLFPLIWRAIEFLELIGFRVMASTSDGASANRRFYKLHAMGPRAAADVVYWTENYCTEEDRRIYFFSDVPHLMKTTRNCWSNSGCHSKKRMLWNGEPINWQTVIDMYKADLERGGLFLCNKLRYEHVHLTSFSRMKVKYAVQVLSTQVANAIETFYGNGHRATIEFIRHFDKFFDCMNVRSTKEGIQKRKPNLLPYRSPDDERLTWLEGEFLTYLSDWDARVDARVHLSKRDKGRMKLSQQTLEGIRMSVKSFVDLARYLLNQPGVECVLSEKLNQDPLESYFGNQRQMKGGNEAPSVQQFCQNANALRLKSSHVLSVRGANVTTMADAPLDNTALPRRSHTRHSHP